MIRVNSKKLLDKRLVSFLTFLTAAIFSCSPQVAQADVPGLPPAGNVSCTLTDEGVYLGISMTFENSITITDWSYTWMYSKFVAGAPNLVSSYGAPMLLKSTTVSGLRLNYSEVLTLAGGNPNATILVTVGVRNGSITNATGRGCYFELPAVLDGVKQAENAKLALVILETKVTDDLAEELLREIVRIDKISEEVQEMNTEVTPMYELFQRTIADIREQITSLSSFIIKVRQKVRA